MSTTLAAALSTSDLRALGSTAIDALTSSQLNSLAPTTSPR